MKLKIITTIILILSVFDIKAETGLILLDSINTGNNYSQILLRADYAYCIKYPNTIDVINKKDITNLKLQTSYTYDVDILSICTYKNGFFISFSDSTLCYYKYNDLEVPLKEMKLNQKSRITIKDSIMIIIIKEAFTYNIIDDDTTINYIKNFPISNSGIYAVNVYKESPIVSLKYYNNNHELISLYKKNSNYSFQLVKEIYVDDPLQNHHPLFINSNDCYMLDFYNGGQPISDNVYLKVLDLTNSLIEQKNLKIQPYAGTGGGYTYKQPIDLLDDRIVVSTNTGIRLMNGKDPKNMSIEYILPGINGSILGGSKYLYVAHEGLKVYQIGTVGIQDSGLLEYKIFDNNIVLPEAHGITIYNVYGVSIENVYTSEYDFQHLTIGVYFAKLDNGQIIKFSSY